MHNEYFILYICNIILYKKLNYIQYTPESESGGLAIERGKASRRLGRVGLVGRVGVWGCDSGQAG